jgi:nitrogen fixation NifU-like protein
MRENMTGYSDVLLDHFRNPRNVGEIPDAHGVGRIGDPTCGDVLAVWLKVENEHVADIRFKCRGCPAAIATASMMTQLARGRHLNDASEITPEMIEEALGGLPEAKRHCSNLGAAALQRAIISYIYNPNPV